jgi:hypothetical protein
MAWFYDLQARVLRGDPGDGIAPERIHGCSPKWPRLT